MVMIVLEMGLLLPPLGMIVFIVHSVAPRVPQNEIFRGEVPFFRGEAGFPRVTDVIPKSCHGAARSGHRAMIERKIRTRTEPLNPRRHSETRRHTNHVVSMASFFTEKSRAFVPYSPYDRYKASSILELFSIVSVSAPMERIVLI